jgi:hypothetical protein
VTDTPSGGRKGAGALYSLGNPELRIANRKSGWFPLVKGAKVPESGC